MNILLDTHAFLWLINGDEKLSSNARQAIEKIDARRFISIASLWEMTIKSSIGKLTIPLPVDVFYKEYIVDNDISVLPITAKHLDIVHDLPFHHKDPFDRLIIAQALTENLTVVSCDTHFSSYKLDLLW